MPVYLIAAYSIFTLVPLGLAISIAIRRRRVRKAMEKFS